MNRSGSAPLTRKDKQRELWKKLMASVGVVEDEDMDIPTHYTDPRVCRRYLAGICPHELFANTRMDIGPCDKLHDVDIKLVFRFSHFISHSISLLSFV